MIHRYLVAPYDPGMEPPTVLTKTDPADAAPLTHLYAPLRVRCPATRPHPRTPAHRDDPPEPAAPPAQAPAHGAAAARRAPSGTRSGRCERSSTFSTCGTADCIPKDTRVNPAPARVAR